MSLMIKGIDLPKEGEMIVIGVRPTAAIIDTWDVREVDGEETFIKREYIEHADVIQIPKDHGNLKDVDTIYRAFSKCAENETDERKMKVYAQLMGLLLQAPTILEEEDADK